jgi:hypothetical protein
VFLIDLLWNKKIRWTYILGGILGISVVLAFNWLYFGELVNNTIMPKNWRMTTILHSAKLNISG